MTGSAIGRRRTQGGVAAAVLCLALLASACGGGDGDGAHSPAGSDAGSAGADAPDDRATDPEATLRVGFSVPPASLDPHVNTSQVGAHLTTHLVYDRLFEVGAGGEILPGLATSWEYSPDGLTLSIELRDDAVFHDDGSPVTAAAVKASIERGQTAEGTNQSKAVLEPIESIEVVDDHHAVFHLDRPAAELLNVLADASGSVINPAAIARGVNLATTSAGSGPYVVDSFDVGTSISYVRADGYWNPEHQKVARIEYTMLLDLNARVNALRTGQIDLTRSVGEGIPEYRSLADSGDFTIHEFAPNLLWVMRINNDRVTDLAVRQAAMRAVDRDGISAALFDGTCQATVQPFAPGVPGHVASLEQEWGYDPDAARAILEEAGISDAGFDGKIMALEPQQDIAVALENQFGSVGIAYELQLGDAPTQFAAFNNGDGDTWVGGIEGEAFPAAFMRNGIFRPLHPGAFPPDGPLAGQMQADVDRAVDASISEEERTALLEKLSTETVENAVVIPICRQPSMNIASSRLVGVEDQNIANFTNRVDFRVIGVATS